MSKFKDQLIEAPSTAVATEGDNPWSSYGRVTGGTFDGKFLKFSKGDYLAGQDSEVVPIGTRLIAIMTTLETGWKQWQDGRLADQRMGLIAEGYKPPRRAELGDTDRELWEADDNGAPRDPWAFTNEIVLTSLDGDEQYKFATNSRGGISCIGTLCKEYGAVMRQRPDDWPVISLEVGSYMHSNRSYGRIKYPEFPVVDWVPKDGEPPPPKAAPAAPAPKTAAPKAAAAAAARF